MLAHPFGSLCIFFWCNIVTLLGAEQAQKSPLISQGAVGQVWFGLVWLVLGFDQAKAFCFFKDVVKHRRKVAYRAAAAVRQVFANRTERSDHAV